MTTVYRTSNQMKSGVPFDPILASNNFVNRCLTSAVADLTLSEISPHQTEVYPDQKIQTRGPQARFDPPLGSRSIFLSWTFMALMKWTRYKAR